MGDYDESSNRSSQRKPSVGTPQDPATIPKRVGESTGKPYNGSGPLPKPRNIEQTGHREASWVQPPTANASGLVHVGSIYFRTKDSRIEDRDRQLLGQLAGAYARYAERDKGRHTGSPIFGNVIAFADPRSSDEPDNVKLSQSRARTVATELDRAFAASPIVKTLGFKTFDHEGGGVDPAAPADAQPGVEANALAPFRRADIYIYGKADSLDAPSSPNVDTTGNLPRPPDYSDRKHEADDYTLYVERGDRDSIRAIAIKYSNIDSNDTFYDSLIDIVEPIAPPWATRTDSPARLGRGGPTVKATPTKQQELIEKARRFVADYRLFAFYLTDHGDKAHLRRIETLATDREANLTLSHIRFMYEAIKHDATELRQLAEED